MFVELVSITLRHRVPNGFDSLYLESPICMMKGKISPKLRLKFSKLEPLGTISRRGRIHQRAR